MLLLPWNPSFAPTLKTVLFFHVFKAVYLHFYFSGNILPFLVVVQLLSHVRLFVTCGLQHARLLCTSLSCRVCSDSCPLSWWCHPIIPSFVTPISSCTRSFVASVSFPMSWLFASGGQSIGASASVSVLPMNIQGWFPLGLTGLTSLLSKAPFKHKSLLCYSRSLTQPTFSYWSYLLTDTRLLLTVEEILLCVHSPFTP